MDDLCIYAKRPFAFCWRYVRARPVAHGVIMAAVLGAVACSVTTQYGIKFMVDILSRGPAAGGAIWVGFALLVSLIAADSLLWRVAGWLSCRTFVGVTGDLRGDLFRHLTGHAPSYFLDRLPGTLTSRVTATSNAVFMLENKVFWNVLPPCIATVFSIGYLSTVSMSMAAGLAATAAVLVVVMFRLAAAGAPLHRRFADRAAAVDGEMVDIVTNMPLVRAFGGLRREHDRFDATLGREMAARSGSLFYLEKLRLLHAVVTVLLTIAALAWAVTLWRRGMASAGDVVMVATLGFGILNATRDLAVALVDATQHIARLSEAIGTLLVPHELRDSPDAVPLLAKKGAVRFENVSFRYPNGRVVFDGFDFAIEPGSRVGLIGESGGGKSTLFALLQRFHAVQAGRILIDGQDIALMTRESLHEVLGVVPQDISLFHRTILENIRYGRPNASAGEVRAAMEAALCREFVDLLPEGGETIVGDRGVKLSGGQRQRIAIARAILKNAPILLLDEATSALDTESEDAVRGALDRLMRDRTVIAIAHRLSTLRGFDRIVVLQAGRVIEDGPPDQLIRRDGLYRELVEKEMSRLARRPAGEALAAARSGMGF